VARPHARSPFVVALAIWGGLGGCGRAGPAEESAPSTEGSLVFERAGGRAELSLDVCISGEAYDFYGVILQDESDPRGRVKLVEDPLTETRRIRFGYSERAEPDECYECVGTARGARPDEVVLYFEAGDRCEVFETEIENTNSSGHYLQRRGRIRLDCATAEGEHLEVDAVYRRCS